MLALKLLTAVDCTVSHVPLDHGLCWNLPFIWVFLWFVCVYKYEDSFVLFYCLLVLKFRLFGNKAVNYFMKYVFKGGVLWTISICLIASSVLGSHKLQPYFNLGLTIAWYAIDLMSVLDFFKFLLRNPKDVLPFEIMLSYCRFYFRFDCSITHTQKVNVVTDSRMWLWRMYLCKYGFFFMWNWELSTFIWVAIENH